MAGKKKAEIRVRGFSLLCSHQSLLPAWDMEAVASLLQDESLGDLPKAPRLQLCNSKSICLVRSVGKSVWCDGDGGGGPVP